MSSTIPRDSHQRSHASALAARADALSTRIRAVTTPLYTVGGHTKPDAIGTGVLVAIANSRFLITAAHVLDWRLNQPLAAGVNNGLSQLDGDVGRIYAKSATGVADDPVDIGIVRLRGQQWNSIPESAFATWDELDLSLSTPRRHTYGLVGYPLTKQRSSFKGTTLTALAYEMAAIEAPRTVYKALTRDPGINLVLGFDKRRMWGPRGMVEAPDTGCQWSRSVAVRPAPTRGCW